MWFLKLIRFPNLFMVLLTMVFVKFALLGGNYQGSSFSTFLFSITTFSILLITAAGYIVNDILDSQADKINKPKKVFVGKSISFKTAWWLYGILNILGLIGCLYVTEMMSLSYGYLFTYTAVILALYLYSKHLKSRALIGNLVIALFCAGILVIIFLLELEGQEKSGSVWESIGYSIGNAIMFVVIVFYAIFSFLTTLIREIIKDIEDINGDYQMKMKTLPIVLGRRRARNIAIAFTLILLMILGIVINTLVRDKDFLFMGIYLVVFTLIPTLFFTYHLWSAKSKNQFHLLSNLMKLIMLFGILSMILFTFV